MSKKWIATDEFGQRLSLDNFSTQKWLDGHTAGLDVCVNWLCEKATALFAERKTQEAIAMQKLADEMQSTLRPQLQKRADEHRQEFPSELPE